MAARAASDEALHNALVAAPSAQGVPAADALNPADAEREPAPASNYSAAASASAAAEAAYAAAYATFSARAPAAVPPVRARPPVPTAAPAAPARPADSSVVVKVGMVGDSQIGKTSLMVKYVEGAFDDEYIQTLGVNFMEKVVSIRNTDITFSVWDLGGQREFINMLPLVCNDAMAILFMFDLTRKSTLNSIKEWYRQARGFNKTAVPLLVGTKYDQFVALSPDEQEDVTRHARKFARAMKAPLIFCSTSHSINIQKIFKIVLSKVFDLKCSIPRIEQTGAPILEY